jgi:hypothetical protein
MRVFRICPAPGYTSAFRRLERVGGLTFDEQIALYRRENVLLPGGFAASMEKLGFEIFETNYNDLQLQGRWAEENGCGEVVRVPNVMFEILKRQVKAFKPDVLFFYAGAFFWLPRDYREELRAIAGPNTIVTGFWGDELPAIHTYSSAFGDLDFVFTSSSAYSRKFEAAGITAKTIGNCFDDTIAYRHDLPKVHDFVFSGVTGYGYGDHYSRYERLIKILVQTDLEVWTKENKQSEVRSRLKPIVYDLLAQLPYRVTKPILKAVHPRGGHIADIAGRLRETGLKAKVLYGGPVPYFSGKPTIAELFPSRVNPPIARSSEYYELLVQSKLVLNLHRDEDADIGNIRCYEVAGVGSCLVTDRGKELAEFFDVENDIVTFESVDELVSKVDYLLKNPAEIDRISANGQKTVLAKHTVAHRCEAIAEYLREHAHQVSSSLVRRNTVVHATYDLAKHPISFDISFFLQAADVFRQRVGAEHLAVSVVWPESLASQPGVSTKADAAVNLDGRTFRTRHILEQTCALMNPAALSMVAASKMATNLSLRPGASDPDDTPLEVIQYPDAGVTHHASYFQLVNAHPELVRGFSASREAHRYARAWLDTFIAGRRLLCITLRQYAFDPQRNSNIEAWAQFLDGVDTSKYAIVVMPDTDHAFDHQCSALGKYPAFTPGCFDVDLRFALYEQAYLNMFVNNGPAFAAGLDKNVRYLLFNILDESVPHCTEEFLLWLGYKIGVDPGYATPFQKWIWKKDDLATLKSSFREMEAFIDASQVEGESKAPRKKRAAATKH